MAENWVMISLGALLVVAAFFLKGVANKAIGPVKEWYPPTMRHRIVLAGIGVLMLILGLVRLTKK